MSDVLDDLDPPDSDPSGLGPGDSLSPISPLPPRRVPAAEVKVRRSEVQPLHPVVKYGGIGGLLAFLGGLAVYLFNRFFSDWTRP
jgi:hypothetical protein